MSDLGSSNELVRQIRRTAEMSAEVMRDRERTGGWEGAERVARQFDRIAKLAGELDSAAHEPGNALLGAAMVRVQHYERALRKVREQCDCNGDLRGVTICDEALYSDSPSQPPGAWRSGRPPNNGDSYIVANDKGQVAPYVRGIIHNNVSTPWDWNYGEAIVAWQPLPTYSTATKEAGL